MVWNVEFNDTLEGLRGASASQVLRVAHEAHSNVMRHSGASWFEVSCCINHETPSLRSPRHWCAPAATPPLRYIKLVARQRGGPSNTQFEVWATVALPNRMKP